MKFGTALPITAMSDPGAVREFAQALDQAEFDFLTSAGHVLSVPADRYTDRPPATFAGPFHDPFVVFAYLAAITRRLHFRPGILILPLYPTALVAKQGAELQQLSGGRFELGVGISWNPLEYQALGQDFAIRGRRLEEQIEVLRRLWSEPYVTFDGRWHTLDAVGLNRLPSPSIPVWMGGNDERALRRAARLADGFIPLGDPVEVVPKVQQYVREAGRDAGTFGITARVVAGPGGPEAWIEAARRLQSLGASHLSLSAPPDLQGEAALRRLIEARQALSTGMEAAAQTSER
jgi:probable F420-dependent oxidoreductase